jgi:hypothetical protein
MTLFHGRWREQVALLASGALEGETRARAEAHRAGCAECARDFESLSALVTAVLTDPAREARMPIALSALQARVSARLDEAPRARTRGWAVPALAAALVAALGAGVLWRAVPRGSGAAAVPVAEASPSAVPEPEMVSDETLLRLERTLARERTVRYLSEAEDVIVTVASTPERCKKGREHVDVGDEARRSRELLARRSLLVELDSDSTPQAQDLLDDVEQVLRDVAALDACARRHDLEAIHRDVSRRRLLMKIDLMTRELQG